VNSHGLSSSSTFALFDVGVQCTSHFLSSAIGTALPLNSQALSLRLETVGAIAGPELGHSDGVEKHHRNIKENHYNVVP
jgi:hypothetical protein